MASLSYTEKSPDSDDDDDSDYEPPIELFSEEGKTLLNYDEIKEARGKTRNSQHLFKTNLHSHSKFKNLEKSEGNLVIAKMQADNVYKSFLDEAAAELKASKNEPISFETVSFEVNSGSSVNDGCRKESCSSNVNISEGFYESTKNYSSVENNTKTFHSDLTTNLISNAEKKSTTLHPFPTLKRRDLKSVMGNVLKKSKNETILSKSKQDWQKFKEDEGIANELKTYNQGKGGYLERQRFLERSDLRKFQIEREMRLSKRQIQEKNSV